jgi:hypothetical protein
LIVDSSFRYQVFKRYTPKNLDHQLQIPLAHFLPSLGGEREREREKKGN